MVFGHISPKDKRFKNIVKSIFIFSPAALDYGKKKIFRIVCIQRKKEKKSFEMLEDGGQEEKAFRKLA